MDSPELGSLEAEDNHRAVHMQLVVDIRLREELADRSVTFVEEEALPLLAIRTCHLSYPSQSCVESAYMRKPCNKPYQPSKRAAEKPLEFLHFLLS